VLLNLLELLSVHRFTLAEDANQERVGIPGYLCTLVEQTVQHIRSLLGTAVVHKDRGPKKPGIRPDVPALENWFDCVQGHVSLALGVLLVGLGQDGRVTEAFRLKPVVIPQRKNDDGSSRCKYYHESRKDRRAVLAEKLLEAVRCAGASGQNRLMLQVAADVLG